MPDFNPDKEGWMKHDWIVCDVDTPGYVETKDGALPFDREGRFMTKDPGLAQELKDRYQHGEITVSRGVDKSDPHERGHKYIFTVPEMPWKKKKKKRNGD